MARHENEPLPEHQQTAGALPAAGHQGSAMTGRGLSPAADDTEILLLKFKHLRNTGITRLAEAQCSAAQIAAISGHSYQSMHDILQHYISTTAVQADSAIHGLMGYLSKQGIRV